QDEVLPLDLDAQVADLKQQVSAIAQEAGSHIDLSSVSANLNTLGGEVAKIKSMEPAKANKAIKTVSHALTALSFTYGDRFDHAPAMPLPAFPTLDGAKKLAKLDPESNDYGFLFNRLIRNR